MMGMLVFFVLCILIPGSKGIELTEMYGAIQSPNFPESYPKDSEVTWNISVPDGFKIKLYFMHFDLEPSYLCEYDYVKLEAEQESLATFCGREDTDTEQTPRERIIMSPKNRLSITFRSDFSNEERFTGFEAHYTAVDVDECKDRNDEELACDHYCHNYIGGYYCSCRFGYLLHSDNRTCRVECSDVFTERSGVITSSDFPNPYAKSSDCLYRIELEEGFVINLEFDDTFDIEDHPEVTCPYDYLKIKAGEREFGPLCGDRSPAKIETGNNSVQIIFHSDNSGENIGWRMSYTAVGTPCPNPVPPVNGKIEPVVAHYSFKDQVLITCDPGYNVLKDDIETEHHQIQCQRDGSWSSFIPICKIVDCQTPADLEKGFVTYGSSNNLTVYGSSIQYSCKEPIYQMYPKINSSYVCGEKGAWTNEEFGTELPSCMAACGEPLLPLPGLLKRIVGGRSAEPGYFPWQVLIMVQDMSRVPEDKWFGSGALLSESWVLTAAHVLRSQRRDSTVIPVAEDHVVVYLGLHNVHNKANAVNRSVEKIILHEDFDPRIYNNDIALVKLKKKVSMNPFIMPICLPPTNQESSSPQPNTLGLVAGWGISNPNISMDNTVSSDLGTVSDVLQYVKLPVVLQTECQSSYASRSGSYNITDNMFCAGFYEGGKDTCLGDSGGAFTMEDPKTKRWVVQGLVSWGGPEECGSQRVYGVYTKVANYGDWLGNKLDMKGLW
ncbi:mannan-binding lectin serine protease 1 isoform X1 [Amia ocellicauda]|uniref:mannan-binding lectin serine protease 1 isoform X1 n=1 Tax=Amia ocellicauda TaxID=2972642 RepID=UPI003464CFC5